MSNYIAVDTDVTSIANAIRAKGGTQAQLSFPTGFVSAINAIPTGSSTPSPDKQVIFIDYDGTLLYSYTKEEANALTNLPANPSHTGLVAQGWNWTLAEIKAQLTNVPDGDVVIGQMYTTSSGKTEIDVVLQSGRLSPNLCIEINGTVTIDWGDNSAVETITGTSIKTAVDIPHTYASPGSYTISIGVSSGEFTFSGEKTPLLRRNSNSNDNNAYKSHVRFVRIGNGITQIGDSGFYLYHSLEYLTIPKTITSIGGSFCWSCFSLKALVFPRGVPSVSNSCPSCYALRYVSVPYGITTVGSDTFSKCYFLQKITIPYSVTAGGSTPFQYCYSLEKIAYPAGCAGTGGANGFQYCYSLKEVIFPNNTTTLASNSFQYCNGLKSIEIPDGITSIGNSVFYVCVALESVTMSDDVLTMGTNVFNSCYSLISVELSDELTSIGANSFYYCSSLPSITIPSKVTSMGNSVFRYCYSLKECHMKPTIPPTAGTTMFASAASDLVIYVPYSADHSILEAYKTASNWSTYASKMQEEPS